MMADSIDAFLDDLQKQIFDEARQAYGERGFRRWRVPRYSGRMEDSDGYACITGKCGDTMEMFLRFEENRVKDASYCTDGCASSAISGSFAAELSLGKTPDQLADITGNTVLEAIGKLPKEDRHCATLAAEALQDALISYMADGKNRGRIAPLQNRDSLGSNEER